MSRAGSSGRPPRAARGGMRWAPAVAALGLLLASSAFAARPVRTVVLLLDAVPYDVVAEVVAGEGLFAGFHPPVPLVSAFPSSTSVAMGGLLEPFGIPRSPGYEARFFDWGRRKVRGGGPLSFFEIEFAWREFFDWSRKAPVRSAISGLRPVRDSFRRIDGALRAFFRSDADPFFAYVETTDLIAHLEGYAAFAQVFRHLDAALAAAHREHPEQPFRAVLLSDHGVAGDGAPLINTLPDVERTIRRSGLRPRRRLKRAEDVVLSPFGLVSSFEVYTDAAHVEALGELLGGTVEGVDLCAYRSPDGLYVVDETGRARILGSRPGDSGADESGWDYVVESGDPLHYAEVAAALRPRGGLASAAGSRGVVSDARWFAATARHHYPDALYRLTRAFDLVENAASILCSLEPGHMYGMRVTERLAGLTGSTVRWTHGALFREATLGFLLSDDERFAPALAVRFDEALEPLKSPRP